MLTFKRSCSVKAMTMCIFMTVNKDNLENLTEIFPKQGKFLRAIGRQRLQTTSAESMNTYEQNLFEIDDGMTAFVNMKSDDEEEP